MYEFLSESARVQRRLRWATWLLAIGAGLGIASAVLAKGASHPQPRAGRPTVVPVSRTAPLTPARRRAIDALFDRFVPSAVERDHPLRALALVTPALREGVSRREWATGNLPVFPYQARGSRFHGWNVRYSFTDEVGVDLLLQPARDEPLGSISYTAVVKRIGGRWLVDSFVPAASFAPQGKKPRILAQPDFQPTPALK